MRDYLSILVAASLCLIPATSLEAGRYHSRVSYHTTHIYKGGHYHKPAKKHHRVYRDRAYHYREKRAKHYRHHRYYSRDYHYPSSRYDCEPRRTSRVVIHFSFGH